MAEAVIDASALLALLNSEPGARQVEEVLPQTVISALNLSEVVGKLSDAGIPEEAVRQVLGGLQLSVIPFDEAQAFQAGLLHPLTKSQGLSLGDRGCLSLALRMGLPAITADRSWKRLDLGVEVRVIR